MLLRIPIDDFIITAANGTHQCLVYVPMRETMGTFQSRTHQKSFAGPLIKLYLGIILRTLDFLHTQCHIIHTGKLLIYVYYLIEYDTI